MEQRVEQRVNTPTLPITMPLTRITDAPAIITAPNPTTKRVLKSTPWTHLHQTQNNISGSVPLIVPTQSQHPVPTVPMQTLTPAPPLRCSKQSRNNTNPLVPTCIPQVRSIPIDGGIHQCNIISQEAINFLTECVWANSPDIFTLTKLQPKSAPPCLDFTQVAMPMVHPKMGETIRSYKQLMHNLATTKTWQTAFGKDFGGMAQGGKKTGQKGTNSIFVMTHAEIPYIPKDRTVTYAQVVVNFCPQKTDLHQIRITAGGNLINYPSKLSTWTADLATSKLMWNSMLSTPGAKYMCLDIKKLLDHPP